MKSTDQATRCPACKTVFRVVADQLRVSEGWVRCGRCTNVFNAAENMVDMEGGWARLSEPQQPPPTREHPEPSLDTENWRLPRTQPHRARQDGPDNERLASKIEAALTRAQQPRQAVQAHADSAFAPAYVPPPATGPASAPASGLTFRRAVPPPGARQLYPAGPVDPTARAARPAAPWNPELTDDWELPPASAPASVDPVPPRTPLEWAEEAQLQAGQSTSWGPQHPPSPHAEAAAPAPDAAPPEAAWFDETRPESAWPTTQAAPSLEGLRADPRNGSSLLPSAKPGFMRKAERDQLWRRPHMRALLLGALAGSALLLLVQVAVAYRDLVAARFPASKPVLEGLCAGLGCTVQAARSIDSLAGESSGLVRVDKTPLYKLQVTLRNRATLELALPALDVTFTDSKGDVISRKVLQPQELGSTIHKTPGGHGGTVAAGQEVTLQGTLQTNGAAPEAVAGYTVELFYP